LCPIVEVMTAYPLTDAAFRLALHETAGKKCVWCNEPVVYFDMQIDHLIYKTIDDATLQDLVREFALRADFDVNETYNLVPIHARCNRSKSNKPLPVTPLHAAILQAAKDRTAEVEKRTESYKKLLSSDMSKVFATIEMHRDDPEITKKLRDHILAISSPEVVIEPLLEFSLMPDLRISIDSAGSVHAFSLGDCPNPNCITGNIEWETFPHSDGLLRAGYCDACGVPAVECQNCDTQTCFFWEHEQVCDGCETKFVLEKVGGELWDVRVL
jgi:hypothetical protein